MRTRPLLGWGLFGLGVAAAATAFVFAAMDDQVVHGYLTPTGFIVTAVGLLWLATGVVIVSRQPGNWAGWIFCAIGLTDPVSTVFQSVAIYGLRVHPGSVPLIGVVAWLAEYGLYPIALLPLLFLLFPDGHAPSRRWRWATVGVLAGTGVAALGYLVRPGTFNNLRDYGIGYQNPFGVDALRGFANVTIAVGTIVALSSSFLTVIALRHRYRRSAGDERQQMRWLAFAGTVAAVLFLLTVAVGFVGGLIVGPGPSPPIFPIMGGLTLAALAIGIPVAYGVAIFRYRLYDLDLVIRKTVVFGLLAVFITAVYAAVVGGLGAIVGSKSDTLLSFAAAGILAVAFQPVRDRASRFADRVVYGKRATPYEVLADFSDRVSSAYSTDEVLPRMAELLAAGTGSERATVFLSAGGELLPVASWPAGPAAAGDRFEVRHQGELLGALSVEMPPSEPMDPTKGKLVRDLAAQAGLVLRNVKLIEDLRSSRQRVVAAQDEERRKIERNLHDGAQQQLVALSVKLKLAEQLEDRDPPGARALIAQLQLEAGEALENLRDLARGIYPPLLADQGLAAALEAQARKSLVPVRVEPDGVGRYPPEIEATVYFCALEALQNVAKYAEASNATVRLSAGDGTLRFEVTDDGRGFDQASTGYGTGLQGMADRLDAVGGSLRVESRTGSGTTVTGILPIVQRGEAT